MVAIPADDLGEQFCHGDPTRERCPVEDRTEGVAHSEAAHQHAWMAGLDLGHYECGHLFFRAVRPARHELAPIHPDGKHPVALIEYELVPVRGLHPIQSRLRFHLVNFVDAAFGSLDLCRHRWRCPVDRSPCLMSHESLGIVDQGLRDPAHATEISGFAVRVEVKEILRNPRSCRGGLDALPRRCLGDEKEIDRRVVGVAGGESCCRRLLAETHVLGVEPVEDQYFFRDTNEVSAYAAGRFDPQEPARIELGDGVVVVRMPGRGQRKKHVVGEDRTGDGENHTQDQTVSRSSFHGRRIAKRFVVARSGPRTPHLES